MPKPKRDEKKEKFIERCIPEVIKDGTAEDNEQAFAVCTSIWEEHRKEMKKHLKDAYKI